MGPAFDRERRRLAARLDCYNREQRRMRQPSRAHEHACRGEGWEGCFAAKSRQDNWNPFFFMHVTLCDAGGPGTSQPAAAWHKLARMAQSIANTRPLSLSNHPPAFRPRVSRADQKEGFLQWLHVR
jgi:hypothetical protein